MVRVKPKKRYWRSATKPPTKSGFYLCCTSVEYEVYMVLHYSAKHKRFNAFDGLPPSNAMNVEWWAHIRKAPGV